MIETNKVGRPMLPKKHKRAFISDAGIPAEHQEVTQAIKDSGMSKRKWIRTKLIAAARRA